MPLLISRVLCANRSATVLACHSLLAVNFQRIWRFRTTNSSRWWPAFRPWYVLSPYRCLALSLCLTRAVCLPELQVRIDVGPLSFALVSAIAPASAAGSASFAAFAAASASLTAPAERKRAGDSLIAEHVTPAALLRSCTPTSLTASAARLQLTLKKRSNPAAYAGLARSAASAALLALPAASSKSAGGGTAAGDSAADGASGGDAAASLDDLAAMQYVALEATLTGAAVQCSTGVIARVCCCVPSAALSCVLPQVA